MAANRDHQSALVVSIQARADLTRARKGSIRDREDLARVHEDLTRERHKAKLYPKILPVFFIMVIAVIVLVFINDPVKSFCA
jgi:hypothetical protein